MRDFHHSCKVFTLTIYFSEVANPSLDKRLCSTSQKRVEYILKTCLQEKFNLMINLENILKTSLQDVLKMSWRRLRDVLKKFLLDIFKTFWRRLEDVLKTFLQDVLKTYEQDEYIGFDHEGEDVLKMYDWGQYIGLYQDVFWRRTRKTPSRALHQEECLLGYHLSFPTWSITIVLSVFLQSLLHPYTAQ